MSAGEASTTSGAYAAAGVSVTAGYEVVQRIGKHAARTKRPGVMSALGGFGGCFDLGVLGFKDPVLVSGTDGVGTKLLVAIGADKHDTIGIDCVAMCVNDIVAQGAQPLYFLDYVAVGRNEPARVEQIVAGVAEGCVQAGAALIGGETAEMPGMYGPDDYDLAGFAVGACERSQLIDPASVRAGDVLIGLPSSGVHSNGFSLVRRVLFEQAGLELDAADPADLPELEGAALAQTLLEPTRIYVSAVLPLVEAGLVRGISHITGGGFDENLPRMLPDGLAAEVTPGAWPVPGILRLIQRLGQIPAREMYQVFNMGIGMVLAVRPDDVAAVTASLEERGEAWYRVGDVVDASAVDAGEPGSGEAGSGESGTDDAAASAAGVIYRGSF